METQKRTDIPEITNWGIIGLTVAVIGVLVLIGALVAVLMGEPAGTAFIVGALLLTGGLIHRQVSIAESKRERDATELMELLTDLND